MIKISGKIKRVFESETFGIEKPFEKRNFWLEDISDKYPNTLGNLNFGNKIAQ